MKKTIYYWSPFIDKVATIKAVYNSVYSINKFSSEKFDAKIIDTFGEWNNHNYFNQNKKNFLTLTKYNFLNSFSSTGYFKSRLKYILIFLLCFFPLRNFIKKVSPNFLIIHLVTSLPLFLNFVVKSETKFILRISGKPKLNYIRSFFWKITLKKIYKITFPTLETLRHFKSLNIADNNKFELLYDPIISVRKINKKKSEPIEDEKIINSEFYLAIGRLTKQKNFSFLIECFKDIIVKNKDIRLIIIGNGENRFILEKLILKYNLSNNIYLIGYKENVFKYLKKSKAFVLSSLWEDPGFVLVEAIFCNTLVLSSNCPSGPKEILENERGFLFKSNNKQDFIDKFYLMRSLTNNEKFKKKLNAKIFSKNFTLLNHHKMLVHILT